MRRHFQITVNGEVFHVEVEEKSSPAVHLQPVETGPARTNQINQKSNIHRSMSLQTSHCSIVAPIPGKVVDIRVKEGQKISVGQVLLAIEAMKMENEISAPAAGIVKEVLVKTGSNVASGQELVIIA